MSDKNSKQKEVDDNYNAFKNQIDNIIQEYEGQFALMKSGKIVEYFGSFDDAYKAGNMKYEDGLFSIQKVEKTIQDLGYYSYA